MGRSWGISLVLVMLGLGVFAWQARAKDDQPLPGDEAAGKRLFRSADWAATGLTCIYCHADFNEKRTPDGLNRPAHSLFNAGFRTVYHKWDHTTTQSLREAIKACTVRWLTERQKGASEGKAPEPRHVTQLVAYLQSAAMTQDSKARPIEPIWIETLPSDRLLELGDPSLGARVFRESCASCHPNDGSGPGPSLVRNGYSRYLIAKKIRGIDNPGLNGVVMPAFPLDRLSDRELINVAAYVYQM